MKKHKDFFDFKNKNGFFSKRTISSFQLEIATNHICLSLNSKNVKEKEKEEHRKTLLKDPDQLQIKEMYITLIFISF